MGAGLGNDVAMLTDGRFSGGSHVSLALYAKKDWWCAYMYDL